MTRKAAETKYSTRSSNRLLLLAILLIIILMIVLFTCHKQKNTQSNETRRIDTAALSGLQIPELRPNDEIIRHKGYTLSYNEDYEQPSWVAYVLTGEETDAKHYMRTNKFLPDPMVSTGTADDADYEASGYDRGHLAPAEDMAWSKPTMEESFYYSNMSPQLPAFNRGVWKRLEELVRYWSTIYDSIYIVTGPVLTKGLPTIGHDHVSVPQYFYKVILEYSQKGVRGIGFVLPNQPSAATLKNFAVSIDSVEHLTGLNFFPRLPDNEEEKIESKLTIKDWQWTRKKQQSSTGESS